MTPARPEPRTYTAEHIEAATDGAVPPSTLHQWTAQGFLSGALEPTRTRPRRFTFEQVVALAVMARLKESKIDLKSSSGFVEKLIPHFERPGPKGYVLVNVASADETGGALATVELDWLKLGAAIQRGPEVVTFINLEKLIGRVRSTLRAKDEADEAAFLAEMRRPPSKADYMELIDAEIKKVAGKKDEGSE